jgi:hypothetical protein
MTFVRDALLLPVGYQQITDLSSAVALDLPTIMPFSAEATVAIIQAVANNVRWRDDKDASGDAIVPTAAVGMQLVAGIDFFYKGDLSALRFIEEAASAELNVSYYASK